MPLKFRCYRCNQLLGAPRSKVGAVIACPKCGTALLVPAPEEAAAPVAQGVRPATSVLQGLGAEGTESVFDIRPEDIRVEPGIEFAPPPRAVPVSSEESAVVEEVVAEPVEPEPEPAVEAPPEAPPPSAPEAVPPIRVEASRGVRDAEPYGRIRARDVVLPRSVVLAWSLFVLLALAAAFGAGLLAGHFVWRVHEAPGRLNLNAPGR